MKKNDDGNLEWDAKETFVWEHFKFSADQRLKAFNFSLILAMFADGGAITAIEKAFNPALLILLGIAIALLAIVFGLFEVRSQRLVNLSLPALKAMEREYPPEYCLFTNDENAQRGKVARYTNAIGLLIGVQFVFGVGVIVYGLFFELHYLVSWLHTCINIGLTSYSD